MPTIHYTPPARSLWAGLLAIALCHATAGANERYPEPAATDAATAGVGVQRTLLLLTGSTPERRNKVRVLFYGQSITEQSWSKVVADDLRRRFPHADLEIENRAIGGFASQRLVRPAEHDLYPFYPDLLIFHVYGSNQEYEEIIRNVRSRTTAEVLMQTDHVTKWPPEVADPQKDKDAWWDHLMNTQLLAGIAEKYGCTLLDVRTPWLEYLKSNRLQPRDLLKDDVNLNDHGNYLLAELVKRHLVHRPDLPGDPWRGLVRDYEVGKEVRWNDGKLTLDFEGNRVDVIGHAGAGHGTPASLRVSIDGKKPSEFAGCYAVTRPQPGPWSPLTVVRVGSEKSPLEEDWTLTVTSVDEDSSKWRFQVAGSQTGADGIGTSDATFVSTSGRVKIETRDWFRNGAVPKGYTIKWSVKPKLADSLPAPAGQVTVAQGIPNGRHTLDISGADSASIQTIRTYRPPVQAE